MLKPVYNNNAIELMYNFPFFFQDEIGAFFPGEEDDYILYTPNNSITFKIMEIMRYKMGIIEES